MHDSGKGTPGSSGPNSKGPWKARVGSERIMFVKSCL
jgi:hypothetical protein